MGAENSKEGIPPNQQTQNNEPEQQAASTNKINPTSPQKSSSVFSVLPSLGSMALSAGTVMGDSSSAFSQIFGSSAPAPTEAAVDDVPYTSFSLPKDREEAAQFMANKQKQKQRQQEQHVDDIVTVNTLGDSANAASNASMTLENDALIAELDKLPRLYPLIKTSVESAWKDFFIRGNKTSASDLDVIDDRPLLDMSAEFQTSAMRHGNVMHQRQEVLIKQMLACEHKAAKSHYSATQRAESLTKAATAIRDVERVSRQVDQLRSGIEHILVQLQDLEAALPPQLKALPHIGGSPLFRNLSAAQQASKRHLQQHDLLNFDDDEPEASGTITATTTEAAAATSDPTSDQLA